MTKTLKKTWKTDKNWQKVDKIYFLSSEKSKMNNSYNAKLTKHLETTILNRINPQMFQTLSKNIKTAKKYMAKW